LNYRLDVEEQRSWLATAREMVRARDLEAAVTTCRAALGRSPLDADARLLLAEALLGLGRDAEAKGEVALALRQRPRCPIAYRLLAELALRRDERRAAEVFLRESLREAPGDPTTLAMIAALGAQAKQPAAAAAKLPAASAAAGPIPARLPAPSASRSLAPPRPHGPSRAVPTTRAASTSEPIGAPRAPAISGAPRAPAISGAPRAPATSGAPRAPATSGAPRAPATSGAPRAPATSGFPRRLARGTEPNPAQLRATSESDGIPRPALASGSQRVVDEHFDIDVVLGDVIARPAPAALDDVDVDDAPGTLGAAPITADDDLLDAYATIERPGRAARGALAADTRVPVPPPAWAPPDDDLGEPTVKGMSRVESVALRLNTGLPGFGEFLVVSGALTRWQLFRVLHLKDGKQLRLGEAAVRLGYLTHRRLEQLLARYRATLASTQVEADRLVDV
jgi:hypothetical protein